MQILLPYLLNDPQTIRALSSFYQMIVITSINFTILPLAFYLD